MTKTTTKNLPEAISEFMSICPKIEMDRVADAGQYRFKYASLENIITSALPSLNKVGLAFSQMPTPADTLLTRIYLIDDPSQIIESETTLHFEKNDPQAYGKALTFARRQSLCCMLGLVPEATDGATTTVPEPGIDKPWLNENTQEWNEAVEWWASDPKASMSRLRKKYKVSKSSETKLMKDAEAWSLGSE